MSVYVPTKERIDTRVVYSKSAGYKPQFEDGLEKWIKLNLGVDDGF